MEINRRLVNIMVIGSWLLAWSCSPSARLRRAVSVRNQDTGSAPHPAVDPAAAERAYVLSRVRGDTVGFQTLSARVRVDYESDQGNQQGVTAFIRMQKDSAIWISVAPILGIEVARVLLTRDSVKIMDKIHRTFTSRSTGYLSKLIHIPADFRTIQDILMGNPIFLSSNMRQFTITPSLVSFTCLDIFLQSHYDVFADDYRLQDCRISDPLDSTHRYVDLTFGDYSSIGGRNFSQKRRIFAVDSTVTQIKLDYSRVKFDDPVSFPFYIPSDYQVR